MLEPSTDSLLQDPRLENWKLLRKTLLHVVFEFEKRKLY